MINVKDSLQENNIIKIIGEDLSPNGFLFEVGNRWGNQIYKCESLQQMSNTGWDAKVNDVPLSPGLYPFLILYQHSDGEILKKEGYINIQ